MKLSQLSILFVAIFLMIVIQTDIKTNNLRTVAEAKIDMDESMDQAIERAADALVQINAVTGREILNKEKAADEFLSSMYASLGILSDPLAQEKFQVYIPVIAVTDTEGYYLMYNETYTGADGYAYISRRWTERIPYIYEDDNFIYRFTLGNRINIYDKNKILDPTGINKIFETGIQNIRMDSEYTPLRIAIGSGSFLLNDEAFKLVRSQAIVSQMEKNFSWYISKNNDIAERFGISYRFMLPVSDTSEWSKALEGTTIIIILQGMPLTEDTSRVYNRMSFSGAGLRKGNVYYIGQHGWYYLYHKEGCPLLAGNLNIREEHYSSVEECALLGAYACETCDPAGVHAPSYEP